jgi:DNA-binding NarL/FixJ family response regulator
MDSTSIYIVDDHQIMREGLRLVLANEKDLRLVGEAGDGDAALAQIEALHPDVAVVDIELPGLSGIELAKRLCVSSPETRILILSGHADLPAVREALRAGVAGFLLKAGAAAELLRAIRAIVAGGAYFCPYVSAVLAQEYRRGDVHDTGAATTLTARETDILRRIAEGQSTKEIAFALQLSTKTVETHRANLMTKLGVFNVAGLTKYAVRERLSSL